MNEKPIKATLKKKRDGTYLPFDEIKYLYMPYELHWTCPGCNENKIIDLEQQPIEYPEFNKPFRFTVYCEDCDVENRKSEYKVSLKLNLRYKLNMDIDKPESELSDTEQIEKKLREIEEEMDIFDVEEVFMGNDENLRKCGLWLKNNYYKLFQKIAKINFLNNMSEKRKIRKLNPDRKIKPDEMCDS
ncbi:MAG: hypothetical protein ACFFDB_00655 [Promethearchaeota archaeon]